MRLKQTHATSYYSPSESSVDTAPKLMLISRPSILTEREYEILGHCADGYTAEETARILFLSPETIVSHRKSMMKKFGVPNVAAAVAYALRNKLIV